MKIMDKRRKFLDKHQLVNGNCYSLHELLYIKVSGESRATDGIVCLSTGGFTPMSLITSNPSIFLEVAAEVVIK